MDQNKKIKLGLLAGMIISYFLPWYNIPSIGGSATPLIFSVGFEYYHIFIGLVASIVALVLVIKNDVKFTVFVAAVCIFSSLNLYFLIIPIKKISEIDVTGLLSGQIIKEIQQSLTYGFYIYSLLSLAFFFIAFKEKGLLDKLTNKTAPAVNTGEAAPVQNVTPVTPKVKKPPIKISKTTKIIAAVVILLAAAGGGYYKFIYTPEYQAFDFLKQTFAQILTEANAAEAKGATGEADEIAFFKDFMNRLKKEHPRMIFTNCFVGSIEKVEKKETTTYSEADYNKQQPIYRIHIYPFKKLEDGKIVILGSEIIPPVDLIDESDLIKDGVVVNVYDEKLLANFKILPTMGAGWKYYLTDISVKVKFAEGGKFIFDLLEITEVKNVMSAARSKAEELFNIDYECLYKSGIIDQAYFSYDSLTLKCIKQIKPIQDTIYGTVYELQDDIAFVGTVMYGQPYSGKGKMDAFFDRIKINSPCFPNYYHTAKSLICSVCGVDSVYLKRNFDPNDYLGRIWYNSDIELKNGKLRYVFIGANSHSYYDRFEFNITIGFDTLGNMNYINANLEDGSILKLDTNETTPTVNFPDGKKFPVKIENGKLVLIAETEAVSANVSQVEVKSETATPLSAIKYFVVQDPDGFTNLRNAPNGDIVKKVYENQKFEVIGTDGKFKKVKLADGTVGFIHESRVVEFK